ncbi:hypothetical protein 2 [Changjiang tombus-like virus 6]|uniref:hypothetical protein 2 n=1 Tax=Changjiang tombus-like virus 6 TaxID=1922820 RepID=UPI0009095956|nr:hypothetical protein 2 [Changjiang tombus-like virus 6]APG76263.1 hypothetical protein 2 [Changjiang tombus-like virus 6]
MAKKKNSKNKTVIRRVAKIPRSPLDAQGLAYARLLADPCNAPLVHPVYSGTEGGYLIRADSFLTVGANALEQAGVFQWVPGGIDALQDNILLGAAANATTAINPGVSGAASPAWDFLTNTASQVRCVAACLRIMYPGSESSRSGRIAFGQASGALLKSGVTVTANNLANTMAHYCRTPADEIEVVWKPNDADQLFRNPALNGALQDLDRRAALVCSFAGLPAATGVVFRMTAVYEWQPRVNEGIAVPNLSKSMSSNTLDDVVNYLIQRGYGFINGAAASAGHGLSAGLISGISGVFGVMPSVTTSRSRRVMG